MKTIQLSRIIPIILAALLLASVAGVAAAQRVPFFFPGATAFEPQISVVQSGALNDVQAVVSADRKYVTLNMRATNSTLLALRDFTFQNGQNSPNGQNGIGQTNLGVVGMAPPAAPPAA